mmetsp:Transcript_23049/g.75142  ORF Transcript_23049/g.75142 Transcript_23049/m.75142 type:complete len:274 (+) Transcript_23049:457-1278(+)
MPAPPSSPSRAPSPPPRGPSWRSPWRRTWRRRTPRRRRTACWCAKPAGTAARRGSCRRRRSLRAPSARSSAPPESPPALRSTRPRKGCSRSPQCALRLALWLSTASWKPTTDLLPQLRLTPTLQHHSPPSRSASRTCSKDSAGGTYWWRFRWRWQRRSSPPPAIPTPRFCTAAPSQSGPSAPGRSSAWRAVCSGRSRTENWRSGREAPFAPALPCGLSPALCRLWWLRSPKYSASASAKLFWAALGWRTDIFPSPPSPPPLLLPGRRRSPSQW